MLGEVMLETGKKAIIAMLALAGLGACGNGEEAAKGLTPEQQSVYEDCLEQSQAVAESWETIEQRCKDQVLRTGPQLPE